MTRAGDGGWSKVYRVVRRIPAGRVATYGQIAALAGMPRAARQVGYALHALSADDDDVPWHRVINARGEISPRGERAFADLQRSLLRAEGVVPDGRGRIDLETFGWRPRRRAAPKPAAETTTPTSKRRRAAGAPA